MDSPSSTSAPRSRGRESTSSSRRTSTPSTTGATCHSSSRRFPIPTMRSVRFWHAFVPVMPTRPTSGGSTGTSMTSSSRVCTAWRTATCIRHAGRDSDFRWPRRWQRVSRSSAWRTPDSRTSSGMTPRSPSPSPSDRREATSGSPTPSGPSPTDSGWPRRWRRWCPTPGTLPSRTGSSGRGCSLPTSSRGMRSSGDGSSSWQTSKRLRGRCRSRW